VPKIVQIGWHSETQCSNAITTTTTTAAAAVATFSFFIPSIFPVIEGQARFC